LICPDPNPERVFLENLALIERIIAGQCRRHLLDRADADDYASWAKEKLIENDYAVLCKFAGRSSLATFLTSVLANLFCDYRNSQWGRWRPSAAALRLGPIAIRLEELLYRDGYGLREASELLRATGVELSDAEIARLVATIPARERQPEVSLDAVIRTDDEPSTAMCDWDRDETARRVEQIVNQLVDELPAEDAFILRLRFWSATTVADISRSLKLDQSALYRRLKDIELRLNRELVARGIDRGVVADLLAGAGQ
jgi:RNA polymerase sigma factor (sigma-70 family)